MQRIWTNRNVDLNLFAEKICEFLEGNDFEIEKTNSENQRSQQMAAGGSLKYRIEGQVTVMISGDPQDITLTLERSVKSKPKKYSYPMTLTAFLGGGLLLRDEFKSDEAFLNLKKDLWAFADRTIINISNSAANR